jgi:hypothetical protein
MPQRCHAKSLATSSMTTTQTHSGRPARLAAQQLPECPGCQHPARVYSAATPCTSAYVPASTHANNIHHSCFQLTKHGSTNLTRLRMPAAHAPPSPPPGVMYTSPPPQPMLYTSSFARAMRLPGSCNGCGTPGTAVLLAVPPWGGKAITPCEPCSLQWCAGTTARSGQSAGDGEQWQGQQQQG